MEFRRKLFLLWVYSVTLVHLCYSATSNYKPYVKGAIFHVLENTSVGSSVLNITAIDAENDTVTFGLNEAGNSLFQIRKIGPRLGELILKKELNRELVTSYEFHVTVTDNGNDRKTSALFIMYVNDVNDNKPVFTRQPYRTSIPENTTVGFTVLTIEATDADALTNARVTYRFSSDSDSAQATSKFAIQNVEGIITLNSPLDYETTSRYLLPVVAEDGGNPKQMSETTVIIEVLDISDNPPKFAQSVYLKEIYENIPVGSIVLTVVAKDGDTGINNPIKYDIYSGNDGTFAIDATTGVITVNGTVDAEESQSYKLSIRASEVPDPSSNATVSVYITVIDKNDNPPRFSQDSYSFTLREDLAKPERIVTDELIVRDADKNPDFRHFQFRLIGGDSNKFSIDSSNGELKINATLDYETQVNYTFTIVVTEIGTAEKYSDNATLYLTLINDNDNKPIFANTSYHYTFNEEIPIGQELAFVTATDGDHGSFGQITYELKGDQSSFFAVDSSGNITAAQKLDYEVAQSYQFVLIASDGGGIFKQEGTAIINVTLQDVNDNDPKFTGTPYASRIKENLAPGVIVLQVTVSDEDSGENGRLSLSITSGNIGNAFAINETGFITTTKALDREDVASYILTINASDHGSPFRSDVSSVEVEVLDENDNTPQIVLGSYIVKNISEGDGGGTIVLQSLKVLDGDAGMNGQLTYSMSGGDGRFILNSETGRLQISPTGLDREIQSSFDLVINVTDNGSPKRQNSTTVHVNVLDINDNSPIFHPNPSVSSDYYIVEMDEGPSTLNTTIIQLNATDRDDGLNGEIMYWLEGDVYGYFSLDNTTGKLTVIKELERDDPNTMSLDALGIGRILLEVTATDQTLPVSDRKSATVRVTIKVKDINDNWPLFQKHIYETDVSEAARTGSNVIQVSAEDKDLGSAGKVTYNITDGDPNGMFGISATAGYISIKKPLDAENVRLFNLTVWGVDEGTPSLKSKCFVVIRVDDVNDNDPKFNQSTYTASVLENVALETPVLTVYATDKDKGANGNITYEISNGNQNNAFKIDGITGLIYTAGPIDRENIQRYTLTVKAEDQGQPSSRKAFAEAVITVEDENDNNPRFTFSQFSAEIKEDALVGTTLALTKEIHATDEDSETFGQITYSLKGPGAENFNINASTGIITTSNTSSLDRERNASYSLHVIATDGGNRNATARLDITIIDVNDEPPRFASPIYYVNVSEDTIQGSVVRRITASDLDTGINAQIIYTSTGADAKFYVSRSTGDIIVDSSLDREFKSFYILNITASDFFGSFSDHAQVYITITDVIDDKPYFSSETISVSLPEDAQIGTNVTRVIGLDKDVGDTLSYAIVNGDDHGLFRIDNITGDIITTSVLDRENETEHTLSVQAKDSKGLVSERNVVRIVVTDVNDNFPVFAKVKYTVDYREQSPKDTSILKVTATDADSGTNAQIRYSIVENVTSQISIDALTGLISQGVTELDREEQPFFNFTVNATDQGEPSRWTLAKVSVVLVDINDNTPKFTNETYNAYVKENQPIGTFVYKASATDDDIGSNAELTYGLSAASRDEFNIDSDTGNITTAVVLDREDGKASYTLTLRAVDDAVRSRLGSATLTVTILDVNDHAPIFSKDSYTFEVNEDVAINHSIGSVFTTDRDIGDNARSSYFIIAGNELNIFAINETTGKITTISSLDRETNDSFTLTIQARDHGEPSMESNVTVTVQVNDINDNKPVFSQLFYNVTLKESAAPGIEVITVSATDRDIDNNGNFQFQIPIEDDERRFKINENSGRITLRERLDHETNPLINVTVSATDSGNPPLTSYAYVVIKVADVDDNAPQFLEDKYEASIFENITQGSFVAQVNATDIDADEAHKTIHYRFEAGNIGDKFAIGDLNGTVYLNYGPSVYLNREEKEIYELTVAAISIVNQTEQKSTVPLKITVLDVNDETPSFVISPYSVSVPEDRGDITGKDNTIVTITARDLDLGLNSEIVYSIVEGNEKGYFSLDNKTGVLIKVKPLDRENISFFRLVVSATDKGIPPLSSNTNVSITVLDINDNKPSFEATPSSFSVKENITIGTTITIVNATDKDQGSNMYLEYIVISGNDDGVFLLNTTSGELKTAKPLDHETKAIYKLVIQAKNVRSDIELTSEKDITIFVTDLNDNRPLFSKTSATLSVGENLPVGTEVGTIEAFDSDRSDPVYYYIYSRTGRDVFDLNETSGVMTTKIMIDREETPSFVFLVKASNYQLDPSSLPTPRKKRSVDPENETSIPLPVDKSLQRIKVEINDQNDNGPIFTKNTYTGGVPEDIKFGKNVIRVTANDADIGSGGLISYGFSTTNEDSESFTVDNVTGWIKAAASFAKKRGKEFVLNISAKDNLGKGLYHVDTAIVKIYVLVDVERAVLISGKTPDEVRNNKNEFVRVLQNITGLIINIDEINFEKKDGKYDLDNTAVYFHAVDPETKQIVDKNEVIRRIDENYEKEESNKAFFDYWEIKEIKAYVPDEASSAFPVVLAVAIGLGFLLLIIIIIFVCIVCLLRKRQRRKLRAATAASYGGSTQTSRKSSLSLPNTNRYDTTGSNPMWVDPYHNWGATDDDENSDLQTFKTNGTLGRSLHYGDIMIRPSSTNPHYESKESYTNMVNDSDESPEFDQANGDVMQFSLRRKSGSDNDRTPSPEPYESSPTSESVFYGNDTKYQVTSI